jgi:hypothetical protein
MAAPEKFLSLGFAGISWIEHYLVHGPGDVQGKPIELDDEFATFMLKAYELDQRGARKVRRAFLSRSKGRSKSGFAAMIECFEALGPCRFDHWSEAGEVSEWGYEYEEGEPVGAPLRYVEILNVATEEGQAGNTYDAVVFMLHEDTCSPALRLRYGRLDAGLTRINLPGKRGFIEPVTASNESKDGGKSTFIVADETHLWTPPIKGTFKLGKMHQTMVRNLLKRKQASGWMLETSTMYAEGERSVAEGTHDYAKRLAKSGRRDGKLLFDHRQAAETWDLDKRRERLKALREAYGPATAWMDLESIADYWDDPQATHAEFRRFWLNQPVPLVEPEEGGVFSPGRWAACASLNTGQPTAFAVTCDLNRNSLYLGGSDGESVGIVTPKAFEKSGPWVPMSQLDLFVAEVARISGDAGVCLQEKGPAWHLREDLESAGAKVRPVSFEQFIDIGAELERRVESGTIAHPSNPDLDADVRKAVWKTVNKRLVLSGDAPALEAATLALWGANNLPDNQPWEAWT